MSLGQSKHFTEKSACVFAVIKSSVTFLAIQLACLHCAANEKLAQYFSHPSVFMTWLFCLPLP